MRILRVAGMLLGLAAALLGAVPAVADAPTPTVELTIGWGNADVAGGGTAAVGSWMPFTAVVSLPAGRSDWSGTLVFQPKAAVIGNQIGRWMNEGLAAGGSIYQQPLTVRPGTDKTVVVYAQNQFDGSPLYEAVLLDPNGTPIARSTGAALRPNYITVGVLSDSPAAASLLRGVAYRGSLQVREHHFEKVESLPSTALALSGFHALVIDGFDSSTLSQAQVKAIQDYIGFGGGLLLAGGTGWRRTLTQLPAALVPLRPDSTGTAALAPVMDLIGRHSDLAAPVALGALGPGARVALRDPSGTPLIAEGSYGGGRIVELTFDPALDPVAGTEVALQSWTQAINRAVTASNLTQGGFGGGPTPIAIGVPAGTVGSGGGSGGGSTVTIAPNPTMLPNPLYYANSRSSFESQLFDALSKSPAAALPPLGLLGGLLVGYVLLAGPGNYLLVRRRGRRELTWVTVPLLAALFTGVAYGAGIAYKGSDFVVTEFQMLRVAPGGAVDATVLDAVFSPRRGSFDVALPDGSFAASATSQSIYPATGTRSSDRVNPGRHPSVSLKDVAIWGERGIKFENVIRAPVSLEAHLGIADQRVKGTVTNRGTRPVRDLALMTVSGEWAPIAARIGPAETVNVDSGLGQIPDYGGGATKCTSNGGCTMPPCAAAQVNCGKGIAMPIEPQPTTPLTDAARRTLALVATGSLVMTRPELQALVGTVDPLPSVAIESHSPTMTSIAAIAEPVLLETIDNLPPGWATPRLITNLVNPANKSSLNVWDFELPAKVGGRIAIQYGTAGVAAPIKGGGGVLAPTQVELYDWTTGRWSKLAYDKRCAGSTSYCATLGPETSSNGLVRIRTRDSGYNSFQVQLVGLGAGTT